MNAKEAENSYRLASEWYSKGRVIDALHLLVQIDRNYPGDPTIVGAIGRCRDTLKEQVPEEAKAPPIPTNEVVEESNPAPEENGAENEPELVADVPPVVETDNATPEENTAAPRPSRRGRNLPLVAIVLILASTAIFFMMKDDTPEASLQMAAVPPTPSEEVVEETPETEPEVPSAEEVPATDIPEEIPEPITELEPVVEEPVLPTRLETPRFETPEPPPLPKVVKLRTSSLIRDLNLERAIRNAIDKPTGDLKKDDLRSLRKLSSSNEPIRSLEGLQYCVGLEELNLNDCDLRDIRPLGLLANLRKVYLEDNWIDDFNPLSKCQNLTHLSIARTPVADISWVSELAKLQEFYADHTGIEDVAPLYELPDLHYTSLMGNPLSEEQIAELIRRRPWNDPAHELTDQAREQMGFPLEHQISYGTPDENASFKAEVRVHETPLRIELWWPNTGDAQGLGIGRIDGLENHGSYYPMDLDENLFVESPDNYWADVHVEVGKVYQYWLHQTIRETVSVRGRSTERVRDQLIVSGIKVPLEEKRGHAVVVIDETLHPQISDALDTYYRDLAGDGWEVTGVVTRPDESVQSVKDKLAKVYVPGEEHVFVFVGQVPVPYSGSTSYDGRADHAGAQPSDAYYADLESTPSLWQDRSVRKTESTSSRHHNEPKDGKFDPDQVTSDFEASWGRIYFADMNSFGDEATLTNRYFAKLHRWKQGAVEVPARAIVDERIAGKDPVGRHGWNLSSIVGTEQVFAGSWRTTRDYPFLFGFAADESGYQRMGHVTSADRYLAHDHQVVFNGFSGAYLGDWHSPDNLLRAPLCQEKFGLVSVLASSPPWEHQLQYMAMGKHIGYGMRFAEVGVPLGLSNSTVHKSLMGDPSVRIAYPKPISDIEAEGTDDGVRIRWTADAESQVHEYRVYRSGQELNGYERAGIVDGATAEYVDADPGANTFYMVRAVVLTNSASGSYYNASTGIIAQVE